MFSVSRGDSRESVRNSQLKTLCKACLVFVAFGWSDEAECDACDHAGATVSDELAASAA